MFSNEYGEAAVEVLDILNNTKKLMWTKFHQTLLNF